MISSKTLKTMMKESQSYGQQTNQDILQFLQQTQNFISQLQKSLSIFQKKIQQRKVKIKRQRTQGSRLLNKEFSLDMLKDHLARKEHNVIKHKGNTNKRSSKNNNKQKILQLSADMLDPTLDITEIIDGMVCQKKSTQEAQLSVNLDWDIALEDENILFLDDSPPTEQLYPHFPQHFFENQKNRITKLDPKATIKDIKKFTEARWKEMTPQQRSVWYKPFASKQRDVQKITQNTVNFSVFLANKLNNRKEIIPKESINARQLQKKEISQSCKKVSVNDLMFQLQKNKQDKQQFLSKQSPNLTEQRMKKIFESYGT